MKINSYPQYIYKIFQGMVAAIFFLKASLRF